MWLTGTARDKEAQLLTCVPEGLRRAGERGRGEGRGRSERGKEGIGGKKGGEERGKGLGDSNLGFPRWLHVLAGTCGSRASG